MANRPYPATQVAHRGLIEALCQSDPEIRTKGFWRTLEAIADEEFFDPLRGQPFLPDAFKINGLTNEIEIHEVVRTHDVSERKLLAMGWLWGDFDAEDSDWLPVLFVHRDGFLPKRVELLPWYHRALMFSAGLTPMTTLLTGEGV